MRRSLPVAILAALIAAMPVTVAAQTYPAKPIRIIVPFPAGGTSDILTRLIGAKLTESWGQQVLPDNRPGANGNIGADMVARAAPDGYTLVLMDVGNLAISPSVFAKMPFDIIRDFLRSPWCRTRRTSWPRIPACQPKRSRKSLHWPRRGPAS